MPVVLADDLINLAQKAADDFKNSLPNPFASKSTPTPPAPVADNTDRDAVGAVSGPPSPPPPDAAPAPDPNQPLDRNGVINYVHQVASNFGIDPAAALAVANQEGLNTDPGSHWTVPGEANISFGPPSWFGNGAGAQILKDHGADAARWSWTPDGINYWLNQVASAAKGLTGPDAVSAIVHNFERPREDLAAGEVQKALNQYQNFTSPGDGTLTTATLSPPVAPTPSVSTGAPPDTTTLAPSTDSTQGATTTPSGGSILDQASAFKDSLGNPFQSAQASAGNVMDQAAAFKDSLGDPFQGAKNFVTGADQPMVPDAMNAAASSLPQNPGDVLNAPVGPASVIAGSPNSGDQMNQGREQLIAQSNPLRDVPVVGGATTMAAQTLTDPTNLALIGGAPHVAGEVAGDVGSAALGALDKISPPPVAQASTFANMSRDEIAAAIQRYPEDVVNQLRDQVGQMQTKGISGADINNALRQWLSENPLHPNDEVPALLPNPAQDAADAKAQALTARLKALQDQVEGKAPASPEPSPVLDSSAKLDSTGAPETNGTSAPSDVPNERYDPESGQWVGPDGQPLPETPPVNVEDLVNGTDKSITPNGTIVEGHHNIPGRQGGAVENTGKPPSLIPEAKGPVGAEVPQLTADELPRNITPDMVQAAREQINKSVGDQPALQDELTQLLKNGADPGEIARFMGKVRGDKVGAADILRGVRTGSMAGGLTTEVKAAANPLIQVAMRAPVAAVKAIVKGKPGDVPAGMVGGLQGLAEGAYDGLQTMRYGISDRSALTGAAGGGYGFKAGLDVMGKNQAQRILGTAALGLVRTHGAFSDVAAGIGRGAAAATGATPEAAQEVGQQMALRSGNYGTIGKTVADALEGIKQTNPALDVLGQILVPFYRVGYNVFTQGVERSPVGLVGTGVDVARSKLPSSVPAFIRGPYAAGADASHVTAVGDRLANNMFGVGLAGLGLAQAASGNITGNNPTNGDPKWSVKVAGNWIPLRALGAVGEPLAQSAALYDAATQSNGDVAKFAGLAAGSYVGHVYDETWLRSFGDLISMIGDTTQLGTTRGTQAVKDIQFKLGAEGKSMIPQASLIGQTAGVLQGSQPGASTGSASGTRAAPGTSRVTGITGPSRSTRPAPKR